jgi:ribA/ribD-fused uncharacterized protein
MGSLSLKDMHEVAAIIESNGTQGLQKASEIAGMDSAFCALIASLRIELGSRTSWPVDPGVELKVNAILMTEFPHMHAALSKGARLFYSDEGYCLDNFSAFAVRWRDLLFPTAEHAYQASKFITNSGSFIMRAEDTEAIAEIIQAAPSAHEARQLGGSFAYSTFVREDWCDAIKLTEMKGILRAKYEQHEYVRRVLARNRGKLLIENSPKDSFWGRGPDWRGLNNLGKLWSEIDSESADIRY